MNHKRATIKETFLKDLILNFKLSLSTVQVTLSQSTCYRQMILSSLSSALFLYIYNKKKILLCVCVCYWALLHKIPCLFLMYFILLLKENSRILGKRLFYLLQVVCLNLFVTIQKVFLLLFQFFWFFFCLFPSSSLAKGVSARRNFLVILDLILIFAAWQSYLRC